MTPSATSPVVVELPIRAQILDASGVAEKAVPTVKLLTEPALVLTVCFSILESGENITSTGTLLVFLKFDAPSSVFTKVIKSPFLTPVVLDPSPFTLKVAFVPEVVKDP